MAISSIIALPSSLPSFSIKIHRTQLSSPSPNFPLLTHTKPTIKTPPQIFSSHQAYLSPPPIVKPLVVTTICLASYFLCGASLASTAAANDSIRASGLGLNVANALRRSGWADEAIVFALATLPVIELRGAIPVGYWMQLNPVLLTALSILGNMVPVPIILLYLKRLAGFLSQRSESGTRFLEAVLQKAREKAGPVEEFQWLGLMLFVAVPFPGTGAWTGAIVASVLDMPFWSAVTANFFGVVLAGLLMNLLVNLGIKYAVGTGVLLFLVSTLMWGVLRKLKKPLSSQ